MTLKSTKHYTLLLAFAVSACSNLTTSKVENIGNELKVEMIKKNAYIVTDTTFYNSRVLIVKMRDGTVVITSSPFENESSEKLMKWVKNSLEPKKIVAINTHFHRDGSGGNEVYINEGAEVWSSELTKKMVKEKIGKPKDVSFYKDNKIINRILKSDLKVANNTFKNKDGKIFNFSGDQVEIFFPGHAHSPDNIVVYFHKEKILFGGCMIKPKSLGYLGVANIANWPSAAMKLKKFDFDIIVPGHAKWGGPKILDMTIDVAQKALNKSGYKK